MMHKKLLIAILILLSVSLGGCGSLRGLLPGDQRPLGIVPTPLQDVTVLPEDERPNILFIMTDDLDAVHGTLEYMPNLREYMIDEGLSFNQFIINTPICCPARSTFFRGQYTHNHHVYLNQYPEGGFEQFNLLGNEASTIGTWLQAAGYHTVLIGKYLNGYPFPANREYVPPGWSEWYSPAKGKPYTGFGYALNENGTVVEYNLQEPEYYLTDVMRERAVDVIRRSAATPEPFFLYLSTFAPHEPATPAPRHAELFPDLLMPKSPSFNEADVSDKPFGIRNDPLLNEANLAKIDQLHRLRVQSVQAIDEMIPALFDTLRENGQLENTYIIFASDNGFHMGDHRQFIGKGSPYEEDIRVPFIVYGPGVQAGAGIDHLAAAVDWAPTIADLAGVIPPQFVDGRSLVPLFDESRPQPEEWRQAALLEFYGFQVDKPPVTGPVFFGLRTDDYLFVRYSDDFLEFYNLRNDPYQLENIAGDLTAGQIEALSAQAEALFTCAGKSCAEIEDRAVEVELP